MSVVTLFDLFLRLLLKKSRYFDLNNMIKVFPHDILLEDQTWLLSRMPQHQGHELEDGVLAEEYCVVWHLFV